MDALVIFAKFPVEGIVKKQIGSHIGMDRSAELCRCFIKDLIDKNSNQDYDLYLSFIGKEYKEEYRSIFPDAILYVQRGENLSERMLMTFQDLLDDYHKVVIIGCDVPQLSHSTMSAAFKALEVYDVVIGPATDGGYYLIGMSRPHSIFEGTPWGQPKLLDWQKQKLKDKGLTFVFLKEKEDIDTIEELKNTKKNLKKEKAPKTYEFIQKLDI